MRIEGEKMSLISKKMRDITKRKLGLTPEEIRDLSEEDELLVIVERNRKIPMFSTKKDFRKLGRGNPLLANRRFRTMRYIDSRIDRLCK